MLHSTVVVEAFKIRKKISFVLRFICLVIFMYGVIEKDKSAAWLSGKERCYRHGLGSKLTRAIPLYSWKDILPHFPLLGGFGKEFEISITPLLKTTIKNFNPKAIS